MILAVRRLAAVADPAARHPQDVVGILRSQRFVQPISHSQDAPSRRLLFQRRWCQRLPFAAACRVLEKSHPQVIETNDATIPERGGQDGRIAGEVADDLAQLLQQSPRPLVDLQLQSHLAPPASSFARSARTSSGYAWPTSNCANFGSRERMTNSPSGLLATGRRRTMPSEASTQKYFRRMIVFGSLISSSRHRLHRTNLFRQHPSKSPSLSPPCHPHAAASQSPRS